MPNRVLLTVGPILILIGALVTTGVIPLCTSSECNATSTTVGTPFFNCTTVSCTGNVPVTNNNVTESVTLYYKVTTTAGQTVFEQPQPPMTIPEGQTITYSVTFTATSASGGIIPLGDGGYSFTAFLLDAEGYGVSNSVTVPVTSQTYPLEIDAAYVGVGVNFGGTLPPAPADQVCGPGQNCGPYIIPANAPVTVSVVTLNPQYPFQSWQIISGTGTKASTASPFTFPITGPTTVNEVVGGCLPTDCISICGGVAGSVVITPTCQEVYSSSANGQATSATFTAVGLKVTPAFSLGCQGQLVAFPGTYAGETGTITYSQAEGVLSSSTCGNQHGGGGLLTIEDFTDAGPTSQPTLQVLNNPAYPSAVTLTPAAGTYPEAVGSSVTVSASSPASGFTLTGWSVDGSPAALGESNVTVTFGAGAYHVVFPIILASPSGGGGGGTGGNQLSCSPPSSGLGFLSTSAAILVTVVNKTSESPVTGALVSVSGQTGSTGAVVYTDSAGQACLDNLSVPNNLFGSNTGSANVQVSASGYTTQSITVQLTGGQTTSQLFQMSYSAAKLPLSQYSSTVGYTLILVGAAVTGAGFFTGKKEPES